MNKPRLISLFLIALWFFLLVYTAFDAQGRFGSDIGLQASLTTSSISRIMFMDIGILSTLLAIFIATRQTHWIKFLFALLTLVSGSFSALPFLAWYYWNRK